MRDWLYVWDHCDAIEFILKNGKPGEVYNIAGENELENIFITNFIFEYMNKPKTLIKPVADRLGHDRRYSISAAKLHELGWQAQNKFEDAMRNTIQWYIDNPQWWKPLKSGEYLEYYKRHYKI